MMANQKSMKSFLIIWGGQIFSLLGSQLVQFALVWYLTKTTGSARVLTLATLVALLPQIFLSPLAGALVDRWDRRRVMIVADGLTALATVVLAALFMAGSVEVWHIYLLMFVRSAGGAFHWPAMKASTTLLVPEQHLARISGLNEALWGLASIISPPLGAILLAFLPIQSILAIDIITALIAIAPLVFIPIPNPSRSPEPAGQTGFSAVLTDLSQGLRLVRDWPGLLMILVIAMLLNLLVTPAFALIPIMVTQTFAGGAVQLAWTEAAWGVGLLAGGVLMGTWGGFKRRILTGMLGLIVMGVGLVGVGLTPPSAFKWVLVGLFLAGMMNTLANSSFFAALQATVPADMQGRIFTLVMSGASAMAPLGLLIAGPFAEAFGVQPWFLFGGLIVLALGLASYFVPPIMQFEEQGRQIAEARALATASQPGRPTNEALPI